MTWHPVVRPPQVQLIRLKQMHLRIRQRSLRSLSSSRKVTRFPVLKTSRTLFWRAKPRSPRDLRGRNRGRTTRLTTIKQAQRKQQRSTRYDSQLGTTIHLYAPLLWTQGCNVRTRSPTVPDNLAHELPSTGSILNSPTRVSGGNDQALGLTARTNDRPAAHSG